MNVLLLGGGGREHALALGISKSIQLDKLFITPGNPGTESLGENLKPELKTFTDIKSFCLTNSVEMIVVGPEAPLVNGIYDDFKLDPATAHIAVIGPSKDGAKLEGSKDFAKEFMSRHQIPTAGYKTFTRDTLYAGFKYLEELNAPYVLKADGLAGGKGVLILHSLDEAKRELAYMLGENKFGEAGNKVVIEEFMNGIEASIFVITDGKNYKILPNAKDYKRIGEGDTGLNTGGMGAISPVPFVDADFMQKTEERIIKPTIKGLFDEGIIYKGFIYFGLMNVGGEPFVVEYNVRLGDPEAEVIVPRIQSDLIEMFATLESEELNTFELVIDPRAASTIVVASEGYPQNYVSGFNITGLNDVKDSIVFHAGTKRDDERILSNGGRVLAVTSFGRNLEESLKKGYESISKIYFEGMYYRSDIGFDVNKN